jgi:multisubunit Na+/H+ antiporter MnhE subunit
MSGRRRLVLLAAVWWLIAFGLWLLLTSTVAPNEVLTGLGAAALTAVVMIAVDAHEHIAARPRPGWAPFALYLPVRILVDTWLLTRALATRLRGRRVQGQYVEVQMPRAATAAERRAMEALSTIVASIAPDQYVVDFDEDRRVVLLHELVPREPETLEQVMRRG